MFTSAHNPWRGKVAIQLPLPWIGRTGIGEYRVIRRDTSLLSIFQIVPVMSSVT